MSTLTERQQAAWPEAVARVRKRGDYDSVPAEIHKWEVVYSDEVRPGRGRFINATYVDGEVFAQILLDVYGYPSVSIARLDWLHADANEECDCGCLDDEADA